MCSSLLPGELPIAISVCSRYAADTLFRFLFATTLSVYNKWMFSDDHLNFPYPLFVTTLHMFVQFILAAVLRIVWPKHFRPERSPPRVEYG